MKRAILIFEWCRPRYVRICLDSLERVSGIQDWGIFLSVDGPAEPFSEFFHRVCPKGWPSHVGNLWHVVRSLRWVCEQDYDEILFMDGDVILRTDALQNLPNREEGDVLIGMSGSPPRRQHWLAPQANIIRASDARAILDYAESGSWQGKTRPGTGQVMDKFYPGYDAVFCRYLIDTGRYCLYRDRDYAGHIGVCGVDCFDSSLEQGGRNPIVHHPNLPKIIEADRVRRQSGDELDAIYPGLSPE